MADYGRPKPIDPLWYQPNAWLNITCRCGRREAYFLADFARDRRLPRDMYLYQLVARLRCRRCGHRPREASVDRHRHHSR